MGTQLNISFEEWRPISFLNCNYEISNNYRIRSVDRFEVCSKNGNIRKRKGQLKKITQDKDGYLVFMASINGIKRYYSIHRCYYDAFIGKIPDGYDVHHKNHIKTDNRAENLELVEKGEHSRLHLYEHLDSFIESTKEKCSKPVLQYTLDGEFVAEYPSVYEASKQTGIYLSGIAKCASGFMWTDKNGIKHITKTSGGFIWKYKEAA